MKPPDDAERRLDRIREANKAANAAQQELEDAVHAARVGPRPVTWARIGHALGITAQGAHDRYIRRRTRLRPTR